RLNVGDGFNQAAYVSLGRRRRYRACGGQRVYNPLHEMIPQLRKLPFQGLRDGALDDLLHLDMFRHA
ncbi:MAG: hypothetical protein WCA16_13480, partial [Candidatus Sulfotelmatobacter sp.]